ncbi:armadillo segment polarity protein-like [Panonychus citri]|uniref:armadillo segment polarity protein-like n=1 Tax=Panonychus citri TaxID=50023 RepID=UPI002307FF29|nr:armadillo segment polarity protein-like [Panonychus citri]XP_053202437.1 armadillo segment polarity protein-like [Panonychus citri]
MNSENFKNIKGGSLINDSGFCSVAQSIIDDEWKRNDQSQASLPSPNQQMQPDRMEMASKAIPILIDLLVDEDTVVQKKALDMVLQLSQETGSREMISDSPQLIAVLLDTLSKSNNLELIENAAGILYNISEHHLGRQTIHKLCGIPELIRILSCDSESVIHLAISALHLLLLHQDGSREAVRLAQGLPVMVSLLFNPNEQFLSIVIDCIRLLAYGDSETKLVINHLGGTNELVGILKNSSYPHLLWVTCSTLKVLSACPINKRAIIDCGGLQALSLQLNPNIDIHVGNCLFTIRNLSDAAVNEEGLDMLLSKVLEILQATLADTATHEPTITCVAGILSNLTCNQTNKKIVYELGGVELLVETIVALRANNEIIEPAVCALRHLTCRYFEAELAAHKIIQCQGLVPIINLLHSRSWAIKKAVVGLIRNIALCEANIVPLREHFVIQKLAAVLEEANITAQSYDIGGGIVSPVDPKIETIIEEATSTLKIMAKDPLNKEMIDGIVCYFTNSVQI